MDSHLWLQKTYEEHGTAVYRYILSYLKDTHAAEDLMHDVFLKGYTTVSSGTTIRNERAWLLRVARNLSLDYLRRNGKIIFMDELPDPEIMYQSSEENNLTVWELIQIIEELPATDQEVLRLKIFGDMTFREIGSILKRPSGTVKKRYERALSKIRIRYEAGRKADDMRR